MFRVFIILFLFTLCTPLLKAQEEEKKMGPEYMNAEELNSIEKQLDQLEIEFDDSVVKEIQFLRRRKVVKGKKEIPRYQRVQRTLEQIKDDGTVYAFIAEGARVENVLNGKDYRVPRDIYIEIYRASLKGDYHFIKSKGNKVEYKVKRSSISVISHVTDLKTKPEYFYPEQNKIQQNFNDKKIYLMNEVDLHFETLTTDFTSQLLNSEDADTAQGYRVGLITALKWDFPVEVGLSVDIIRHTLDGDNTLQGIMYGPIFKTKLFHALGQTFKINLAGHRSYSYSVGNYNYKSSDIQVGLETNIESSIGNLNLGGVYRKHWFSPESYNPDPSQAQVAFPGNATGESFGLFVGLGFGVLL